VFHPTRGEVLRSRGLLTAGQLLELPGEVVSGHADRHVVRVAVSGVAYYLKRQHRVGWRERFRQAVAGFGWVSRSEREARLLARLESAGFACPNWVACGEDDRGRAFLLIEELAGFVELRRFLSDTRVSLDRWRLVERAGQAVAELHAAGLTTPDLTAKHIFVNPTSLAVVLIDWQSARVVTRQSPRDRVGALAALHASLAEPLADARERLRFLWAYRRVTRRHGAVVPSFAELVRRVLRESARLAGRRSIRDQRQPAASGQRLVWLAGEAVCAIPDVAAVWPTAAVAPPFYPDEPPDGRGVTIRLPDGRPGLLTRFRSFAPLGRLSAWFRGRPWRSPGATLGRVLFHLERYGIPAPRLLAFGQRETGPVTADSFALHEPPAGQPLDEWLRSPHPPEERREVLEQLDLLLGQLHDAGCRLVFTQMPFRVDSAGRMLLGDVRAVRLVRRVSDRARRYDRLALACPLQTPIRTPER
jgi:tRNA A-37 threonylcarbamoyl transferase component Bud32